MSRLKKVAVKFEETRTYQISGNSVWLDKTEELLRVLAYLGQAGASREISIFADGDGAFRIDVRRLPDQNIVKNKLIKMKDKENIDKELDADKIRFDFS